MKMTSKLLTSVLFLAVSAQAEEPAAKSPVQFSLTSRVRYEDSNQKDLVNRTSFFSIRLRPQLSYEVSPSVKVLLEPQYAKILGQTGFVPSGAGANTLTETSGNSSYTGDPLVVRQALVEMGLTEQITLTVGRQALSYGDQLMIGVSDSSVYGRSFDAVKSRWKSESWTVDLLQAQIAELTATTSASGGNKELSGLYITGSPAESIKALDLYAFYLADNRAPTTAPADANRPFFWGSYGTRVLTEFSGVALKGEFAQNFGQENTSTFTENKDNNMIDAEISTKWGEAKNHRLGLQLFQAGPNWKDLYPTTFTPFGRTDVVGRRNLTGAAIHYTNVLNDRWTGDLDLFYFTRTKKDATAWNNSGTTALGTATLDSGEVGTEVDLTVKYAWEKNVTVSGGLAFFQMGSYLKDSIGGESRSPHYGYLALEAKY